MKKNEEYCFEYKNFMVLVSQLKRVLIDTNIFLSALMDLKKGFSDALPLRIMRQFESNEFLLMSNPSIISEYRKKGEQKIKEGKICGLDFTKWIGLITEKARFDKLLVTPPIHVQTDPSDNIFFSSLNCLNADFFVSGNSTDMDPIKADLLALGLALKIVSPHEFLMVTSNSYKKAYLRNQN